MKSDALNLNILDPDVLNLDGLTLKDLEIFESDSGGGRVGRYFQVEEGEGKVRFDYLLRPGVSSQRLGMRVLREEGVFELLDGQSE